jgi:hypothetical protein
VLGFVMGEDRRVISAISALANSLAPGSALHYPAPTP